MYVCDIIACCLFYIVLRVCIVACVVQKVIERVQAETVPAADFKLTADEDDE